MNAVPSHGAHLASPATGEDSYLEIQFWQAILRRNEKLLLAKLLANEFARLGQRQKRLLNLRFFEALTGQHVSNTLLQ